MKPLIVRWGTQDVLMAQEVIDQNEYRLPLQFDPKDRIIDIGAHIGGFAWACLKRGAQLIECYEPDLDNYNLLRINTRVELNEKALCRVLNHPVWYDARKLLVVKHPNPQMTAMTTMKPGVGSGSMMALTLADVIRKEPCRLLKLDCEGAEVPILQGATAADLEPVEEITGELHHRITFHGFADATKQWADNRLKRLGFKVIDFQSNRLCPDLLTLFWGRK
jgi:FkbM family methyltransferase